MKFHLIELLSNKIEELQSFYSKKLGLRIETDEKGFSAILADSSKLRFVHSEVPHYYHFAINIPENRAQDALNFVKSFARPIPDPDTSEEIVDFVNWDAHAIYFLDPAGNIVELIARHSLVNAKSGSFGSDHLLEISEIGLAVNDVEKAFNSVHETLGVTRYSGNFETFCAAGDENGLFILTHTDRNWFPTDKKSIQAPVNIDAEHDGRRMPLAFTDGVLGLVVP